MDVPDNTFATQLLAQERRLRRFALSLTSNRDDAEDLLQETALKALINRHTYQKDTNILGWTMTIMHNLFVSGYRQHVSRKTDVAEDENVQITNAPIESQSGADEDISVREIHDCIHTFSPDFSEPFDLYVAGYKYKEIAERLSIPIGTVKSRIFYVRSCLKTMLKSYKL